MSLWMMQAVLVLAPLMLGASIAAYWRLRRLMYDSPDPVAIFLQKRWNALLIVVGGMDAEGVSSQGGDSGSDFIVTDWPVFHFCWIARIKTFGYKSQCPHAVPPNDSQQIKNTSAFGMLARRDFFSYGAIIGQ